MRPIPGTITDPAIDHLLREGQPRRVPRRPKNAVLGLTLDEVDTLAFALGERLMSGLRRDEAALLRRMEEILDEAAARNNFAADDS